MAAGDLLMPCFKCSAGVRCILQVGMAARRESLGATLAGLKHNYLGLSEHLRCFAVPCHAVAFRSVWLPVVRAWEEALLACSNHSVMLLMVQNLEVCSAVLCCVMLCRTGWCGSPR